MPTAVERYQASPSGFPSAEGTIVSIGPDFILVRLNDSRKTLSVLYAIADGTSNTSTSSSTNTGTSTNTVPKGIGLAGKPTTPILLPAVQKVREAATRIRCSYQARDQVKLLFKSLVGFTDPVLVGKLSDEQNESESSE